MRLRDLLKVTYPNVKTALEAGGAVRRLIGDENENNVWVVYASDAASAVPIAAVKSDRLARILVEMSSVVTFLPGESLVTKREVAATVGTTVDRRRTKLEERAADIAARKIAIDAELAAHIAGN